VVSAGKARRDDPESQPEGDEERKKKTGGEKTRAARHLPEEGPINRSRQRERKAKGQHPSDRRWEKKGVGRSNRRKES